MLGHPLCTNFTITNLFEDYVMHSSFAYRQFNSNFTCGDPTIVQHELNHSRIRATFGLNAYLAMAWQVLDVYVFRLITLTPPEYGASWETLISIHLFHPTINLGSMLPFCAKKFDNCSLCSSGGIHHATNCGNNSPGMRIVMRSR
ncbi:hypothetical protein AVEN_53515-1 [Araneus ventricosus]|uniref:Uncharacterized protein n=1 Tax=Araneus ventricosus TaxID=182803 RepID=A0A4Y2A0Z1_ARAVE|nr:hypothetical protein AVEN_18982-1 [Araneus ventricosus]GBM14425.1 hypothetical protein AVEN_53515-1 [Araneus ventricosus]